jgi:hypothetical protein
MKECTNAVVQSPKDALGFPILLRSVRAGKPKKNTVRRVEAAEGVIVELTTIIGLKRLNGK